MFPSSIINAHRLGKRLLSPQATQSSQSKCRCARQSMSASLTSGSTEKPWEKVGPNPQTTLKTFRGRRKVKQNVSLQKTGVEILFQPSIFHQSIPQLQSTWEPPPEWASLAAPDLTSPSRAPTSEKRPRRPATMRGAWAAWAMGPKRKVGE